LSAETAFLISTLSGWIGWIALARAVYLGAKLLFPAATTDRAGTLTGLALAGAVAAVGIFLGVVIPTDLGRPVEADLAVPVVWVVLPFTGWLALACAIMVVVRLLQHWLEKRPDDAPTAAVPEPAAHAGVAPGMLRLSDRQKAALIWASAAAILYWFARNSEQEVAIIRGAIPLSAGAALALGLAALAAIVAMVATARAARTRGLATALVTHLALIAGSVVFGLPFAWLLITSFKEDRDMVGDSGLIWVPRVQETALHRDPSDPLLEGVYRGTTVEGTVLDRHPDGSVTIDILRPMVLRGVTFTAPLAELREVDREVPVVTGSYEGRPIEGKVVQELEDGRRKVQITEPADLAGREYLAAPTEVEPVRHVGLRWQNYSDALQFVPPETHYGLVYLKNTLIIVILSVIGTILSSSIVAYAFSRMRFPGKGMLFLILISTMMLPAAVTLLPTFLIFRTLGMIDTLYPLWLPAFFASAFNVFLLRQFFMQIPMELEDAAKIDGCSYLKTFWSVMMPQIKPALAVIAIWTFMGAWNNFMGPLIYINSPENMPIAYAVQLFQGDRGGEPGLLMAFATMAMLPVLLLFFFAQRYFIEGVTLSGLGGR
jgi:multiple sugar transport system permease protein